MLYERLDGLSCVTKHHADGCACSSLQWHYGARLFKCGFLECPFRRHGFSTKSKRASHEKHHETPWKCDEPSCEYADIGFPSKRMRDEHWRVHIQPRDSVIPELQALGDDRDELEPLLFDLVKVDDYEAVRSLLPRVNPLWGTTIRGLRRIAAFSGSVSMTRVLHEGISLSKQDDDVGGPLCSSIEGGNTDGLRWLVSWIKSRDWVIPVYHPVSGGPPLEKLIGTIVECESSEVWAICEELVLRNLTRRGSASAYGPTVIRATARITSREKFLISVWKSLKDRQYIEGRNGKGRFIKNPFNQLRLGDALGYVADVTHSIPLAQCLIAWGANVDARRSDRYKTPLHRAAVKSSLEASQMMRFLLYHGADPDVATFELVREKGKSKRGQLLKRAREEKGIVEIKKWLGITWEELVRTVKEDIKDGKGWTASD